MSTTCDQTCEIVNKERTVYAIIPRPVAPSLHADKIYVVEETAVIEWIDGDVIKTLPDGTTMRWYARPTLEDAIWAYPEGTLFQLYADGSCKVKAAKQTFYWYPEHPAEEWKKTNTFCQETNATSSPASCNC